MPRPSRVKLVAAFAALYIIWGSTYLGIRYAIETLPPLLMAGVRFMLAGAIMYGVLRLRGAEPPTREQWRTAAIVGTLLLLGGNGGVVWAQQRVPSGIAALLVATLPLWMVTIEALRPRGRRPSLGVMAGLVLGLVGIGVLVGPGAIGGWRVDPVGAAVLILASLAWAAGSIYSRTAPHPPTPLLSTGMQMLAGGFALLLAGSVRGELGALDTMQPSLRSVLAMAYLVIFGSLIGFTAYVWLLRVSTPAKVATYAYVNPVVAVFLGWAIAGEPVTTRTLVAAAIIVGAVALITTAQALAHTTGEFSAETPAPDDTRPASGRA